MQSLQSLREFRSRLFSIVETSTPLVSSFLKVSNQLSTSRNPVDPSRFLSALEQVIIKSGNSTFNVFSQQDAPEILVHVLAEFSSDLAFVSNLFTCEVRTSISCDECFQESVTGEISTVLAVPLKESVQSSISSFFLPEETNFFCLFCGEMRNGTSVNSLTRCGEYVVVQLKRFAAEGTRTLKKMNTVSSGDGKLELSVVEDAEVSGKRFFNLKAVICHHGHALKNGHYTALVRERNTWIHCNDRAVVPAKKEALKSAVSYLYFFEASHLDLNN